MPVISILGSTGSIGVQTLNVCRDLNIGVCAISTNSNIDLAYKQALEFNVNLIGVYDQKSADILRQRLKGTKIKVVDGPAGNIEVATHPKSDKVVTAMSGMIGLLPTIAAIQSKKDIALANKETLVCAGGLIMQLAEKNGVKILPVDSEHSAIFHALRASDGNAIRKIILTASGGPFFGMDSKSLEKVTKADALKHPNWSMGNKITIDSATLVNKGLELMEAKWLFNVCEDQIEIVVHRQSIVHSAVEFEDGSIIAQLGAPQMYIPIKYALTYPKRISSANYYLDLFGQKLTFDKPDYKTFKCLGLCIKASKLGGLYPTVLNAANEYAVSMFLNDKIKFIEIADLISAALDNVDISNLDYSIDGILEAEKQTRQYLQNFIER